MKEMYENAYKRERKINEKMKRLWKAKLIIRNEQKHMKHIWQNLHKRYFVRKFVDFTKKKSKYR